MLIAFQVTNLFLSALVLTTTLAHALEYLGKMRLNKENYLATQQVYYPGFTIVGVAEPIAVLSFAFQAFLIRNHPAQVWLTLATLGSLVTVHVIYWLATQPVNNYWLQTEQLQGIGKPFAGTNKALDHDWRMLRNRWEYSHIARACFAMLAFLCAATAACL